MKPEYKRSKFQCPHCGIASQQHWFDDKLAGIITNDIIKNYYLDYRAKIKDYQQNAISEFINNLYGALNKNLNEVVPGGFSIATCTACQGHSLWIDAKMIYPQRTNIPKPNNDLNDEIKEIYNEAASICNTSPKGATALLRLALQKLLIQIGKDGKNINNDIKELVAAGLSPRIQQALDILRVVGNNAVHPGQIILDESNETAFKLFEILNFIANELITKPKELDSLYSEIIPEETQKHIQQRDGI